jgi:tetratricopeptide (TPR) repeat protein
LSRARTSSTQCPGTRLDAVNSGGDVDQIEKDVVRLAHAAEQHAADAEAATCEAALKERIDDIPVVLDAMLARADVAAALDLVGSLGIFWQGVGAVDHGVALTRRVLHAANGPVVASLQMARAQLALGELAFRQGDQETALPSTLASRRVAIELGDQWLIGRCENNLARIAFRDGDAERIFEHARALLAIAGGNERLRSGAVHMLGWAEYTQGNMAAAMRHFEQNVETYRRSGNRIGESSELANLSDLAMEVGELDVAARYLRESFDVPGAADDRYMVASLVRSVATLCGLRGSHAQAVALYAASDAFYAEFGMIPDPGDMLGPRVRKDCEAAMAKSVQRLRPRCMTVADAVTACKSVLAGEASA